ncbi:MAG: hypothetical protein CL663_03585 [Bacteroidetes bacterium]|nr:hypothetical protein [Bacteroidota bacterium]
MFELQVYLLVLSGLITFASSVVKGITGFGFALLAVPLLSLIYPLDMLVPAMVLFNLITSLYILFKLQEKIKWYYIVPMFIASLGGIPLGVYALEYLDQETLKLIIGAIILIFSLKMLKGVKLAKKRLKLPIVFAGFVSGILTSSVSLSGPPLVIAMLRKGYNKEVFRGLFSWFNVFACLFSSVAFYVKGYLNPDSMKLALFSLPLLIIGSGWGSKIQKNFNQQQFKRVVIILNAFTGLLIVVSTIIKMKSGN